MSALTSLVRSLGRHRLFAVLNVGGLALGIAVFLVLLLYVRFETGYDRALPGADRIWLVGEQYTRPGDPSAPDYATLGNELLQLRGDFPQLEGTRYNTPSSTVLQDGQATNVDLATVDTNFFALFPYPVIAGDPGRALAQPDGLVLTESAAKKFMGTAPSVGRALTIKIDGESYRYRVGAVVRDLPANTSLTAEMFVPIVQARFANEWWDHWGSTSLTTLLRFPDAAAAKAFEAQLPGFLERHAYPSGNVTRQTYRQFLSPLTDLHLIEPADRAIVTTLSIVGLLTLLLAAVNYVNLATARAGLRAREVAVRKVLGATRRQLVVQFLGEAIATVALSALIGLALAELALPFINAAGGTTLRIVYWGAGSVLPPLLLLVVVVGGLAGLYPAFLLSGFRPAAVLASARAPGGGRAGARLRTLLVVGQFAVAIAFAISTAVMVAQTRHVADADIGFRRDGLIVLRGFYDLADAQEPAMLEAIRALPGVVSAGSGLDAPGDQATTNASTLNRPKTPDRSPSTSLVDVGPGYFETIGVRLIAGRGFDRSRPRGRSRAARRGASLRCHDQRPPQRSRGTRDRFRQSRRRDRRGAERLWQAGPARRRRHRQPALHLAARGAAADRLPVPIEPHQFRLRHGALHRRPEGDARPAGGDMEARRAAGALRRPDRAGEPLPALVQGGCAALAAVHDRRRAGGGDRLYRALRPRGLRHFAPGEGDRHPQDARRLHRRRPAPAAAHADATGDRRQSGRLAARLCRHAALAVGLRRSDQPVAALFRRRQHGCAGDRRSDGRRASLARRPVRAGTGAPIRVKHPGLDRGTGGGPDDAARADGYELGIEAYDRSEQPNTDSGGCEARRGAGDDGRAGVMRWRRLRCRLHGAGRDDARPQPDADRFAVRATTPARSATVRIDAGDGERAFAVVTADLDGAAAPVRVAALIDIDADLRAAEAATLQELVTVLGHEVTNTLTPIASLSGSAAAMLAESAPDLAAVRTAIDTVSRRALALQRFGEAYRDLARLPAPVRQRVDLVALAADLARLFRTRWPGVGLHVTAAPTLDVSGDPDQLAQAIWALLQNAA